MKKNITTTLFGQLSNVQKGSAKKDSTQKAYLYRLTNNTGMTVTVTNYGANIVGIIVPDKEGNLTDVALGYDTLKAYQEDNCFLGALVGRYAGRIGGAQFRLDGQTYQLTKNHGEHQLHGGPASFNHKLWQGNVSAENNSIEFTLISADGEEGFPGELSISVIYTLTDNNELLMVYKATTTKTTVVNLTQHIYLNLAGHDAGDIRDHLVQINASKVAECDKDMIPTGQINAVEGTAFDLRAMTPITKSIDSTESQMAMAGGYDHYWFFDTLNKSVETESSYLAAKVKEPTTGRILSVYTDQPGMVFYTGNNFEGKTAGKAGHEYEYRSGFCLETQYPADAPNHEHFPSTRLEPNQTYKAKTVFSFSTEAK